MEIKGSNEYTHLLLKNNHEKGILEDITKDVFYIKDDINSYLVGFKRNSKYYHISKYDLYVYTNGIELTNDYSKVYINNVYCSDVKTIIKFGNYYKVFYSNGESFIPISLKIDNNVFKIFNIDLRINSVRNNVVDYYKVLSKYAAAISKEEISVEKILDKLYSSIDKVEKDTVLYNYTNDLQFNKVNDIETKIYPFSTNKSQMSALTKAFNNQLSIISGPPGTGKTQVILNILSTAVFNGLKVAVISNNNTAVENVYEKMKDNGLDFLIAFLGNKDNVDSFFNRLSENPQFDIPTPSSVSSDLNISFLEKRLYDLYSKKNDLQIKQNELYELTLEYEHFKDFHVFKDFSSIIKKYNNVNKYIKLKGYLLSIKKKNFFNSIRLLLEFNIDVGALSNIDDLIDYCDFMYYELLIKDYKNQIDDLKNELDNCDINSLEQNLKEKSRSEFLLYLKERYEKLNNYTFTKLDYKQNFTFFNDRFPIILSTTYSLLKNIPADYKFDLVIMDEASQSNILTSILSMYAAKRFVVVGDLKQLPQIDDSELIEPSYELLEGYPIKKCYQYAENSILSSLSSLNNKPPITLLKEHYRCDYRIIEYCNKKFYNNELIICTKTDYSDPLVIVKLVEGNHARKNPNGTGFYNDREANEILEIVKNLKSKDIGIISPFKAQVEYIKDLIKNDYDYCEVDTIHKYQGRQKDIIILSTVINDLKEGSEDFITNFVTNDNLLNVAISRAIKKIYIVVSDSVYNSNNNGISSFINYIRYVCKGSCINSKVTSIFDILYKKEYEVLKSSACSKKVDSVAEGIMYNELKKILVDYSNYSIRMHIRLSELINNYSSLNEYEYKYVTNPRTHVDFVIYEKIANKPILCIEVDGTKYHDYSKVQKNHDTIKDKILKENNLHILRLPTNGSNEINKIKEFL